MFKLSMLDLEKKMEEQLNLEDSASNDDITAGGGKPESDSGSSESDASSEESSDSTDDENDSSDTEDEEEEEDVDEDTEEESEEEEEETKVKKTKKKKKAKTRVLKKKQTEANEDTEEKTDEEQPATHTSISSSWMFLCKMIYDNDKDLIKQFCMSIQHNSTASLEQIVAMMLAFIRGDVNSFKSPSVSGVQEKIYPNNNSRFKNVTWKIMHGFLVSNSGWNTSEFIGMMNKKLALEDAALHAFTTLDVSSSEAVFKNITSNAAYSGKLKFRYIARCVLNGVKIPKHVREETKKDSISYEEAYNIEANLAMVKEMAEFTGCLKLDSVQATTMKARLEPKIENLCDLILKMECNFESTGM